MADELEQESPEEEAVETPEEEAAEETPEEEVAPEEEVPAPEEEAPTPVGFSSVAQSDGTTILVPVYEGDSASKQRANARNE